MSGMLPYGRQQVDDDDVAAVVEVLRGDWLTGGPSIEAFEHALCEITGAPHAVVVANGTAALHLATLALDIGPGDTVIVPSQTFLATANAVRFTGAEVWFADVDPETGLLTKEHFERAIASANSSGRRVRAVYPVHLNGQIADPVGIAGVARAHELKIVEDSCHAIGTTFIGDDRTMRVGGAVTCDLATFSFHPVKTIAMGEGGALTTTSSELAERIRLLRNHGMTRDPKQFTELWQAHDAQGVPNPWYYEMHDVGFNYRASDLQCALGCSQLKKLDQFVEARSLLACAYDAAFECMNHVWPIRRVEKCQPAWHLYVVHIDFESIGYDRATVMSKLRDQGILTQVHYLPVHRQPYYRERYGAIDLPGADRYYEQALSLPLFPSMTQADVSRVVEALSSIVGS